jgi:RNase adapter protein RapZ
MLHPLPAPAGIRVQYAEGRAPPSTGRTDRRPVNLVHWDRMKGNSAADARLAREFVIVTGVSGAGKSHAIRALEDLGFYCVDNMPPALIPQFAELCVHAGARLARVAVVTDVRGHQFRQDIAGVTQTLRDLGFTARMLFLEASEDALIRRFKETRRRHPLASKHRTLQESIRLEQRQLQDLRASADKVLDTSVMEPRTLKQEIASLFSGIGTKDQLQVKVLSFGYKNGAPSDADLLFDVRFLRNPHYVPDLQPLTGNDPAVDAYVMADPAASEYLAKLQDLLAFSLPRYGEEGKSYLTVGVGCTGGHHRSVVFARHLADFLRTTGYEVVLEHRDIKK